MLRFSASQKSKHSAVSSIYPYTKSTAAHAYISHEYLYLSMTPCLAVRRVSWKHLELIVKHGTSNAALNLENKSVCVFP